MPKPQALIEQVRSSVAVELERRHAPTLLADRKAAKAAKHKAKHHKYTKAAFFRYCYYDPAFKFFCEQVLDVDYLPLPEATRAASEVGVQNSSDYVCTPFKHILGDFAEALDLGADILIQFGGPCRLGYYGELQESILRDMGYDFIMLNFARGIELGYIGWAKEVLKTVNPNIDVPHGVVKLKAVAKMIAHLDSLRDFYLANAGFEVERGSFDAAWVSAMDAMRTCLDERDINEAYREAMGAFRAIPLAKPADPIRIGIVGEMFTAIDERSNLGLDHKLVAMGVEVHRMLNFTNRYLRYNEPNLRVGAKDYLTYDMGPTSTLTVAAAKKYAAGGFDGLIHAKSAGCTPEIDCIPVLQKVSEDYSVPVLYLTYDSQTSDTGLDTRLEAFHEEGEEQMTKGYLGIDIGSISTKGVIIDENRAIIARSYLWTEGNPTEASKNVVRELERQVEGAGVDIVGAGTTGSARRLVGAMLGASVIKNEITAHAVGTTHLHPDVRTILEIGGQDSKIICVSDGIAVDYAMNTLCAAGTGSFLSSQAHRLGVEVEEFGDIALTSTKPANIAARCTVFAESDLVHKIQVGYAREDIIAGLCNAVASNYLNNVGKGKKIAAPVVFQGGVSKNAGVVHAFEEQLGMPVAVDPDGHLMGAFGVALLAADAGPIEGAESGPFADGSFDFEAMLDFDFKTREIECQKCANHCEVICVYRDKDIIDSWGNRCEKGAVKTTA